MTMTIPDSLPVLSKGHHKPGSGKVCAMDAASWLSGHPEEGDTPSCVHPVLRAAFIRVNDQLSDGERHKLWPLILRAMGTYPTGLGERDEEVLSVRLAVWCARSVQHAVQVEDREVRERAVATAEAWCEGEATERECRVAAYAASSASSTYAYAAAAAAAYAAVYAYAAANAAASAAYAVACDRLTFLDGLIGEYERLTSHTPAPVEPERIADLAEIVGSVTA